MSWLEWYSPVREFGCFRAWTEDIVRSHGAFEVRFMDSVCEGFSDVMAWEWMLPYFNSIGLDLQHTAYREEWPESRLDYGAL